MKRLFAALLLLTSCTPTEPLGECNEAVIQKSMVLMDGKIMYGGQAAVNLLCATGCHNSGASTSKRKGAPGYLNFDMYPVSSSDVNTEDSQRLLKRMAKRRQIIRDNAEEIWASIKNGTMPPKGWEPPKDTILPVFGGAEKPCERAKEVEDFGPDRINETIRNWLACGAQVIDVNTTVIEGLARNIEAMQECNDPMIGVSDQLISFQDIQTQILDVKCSSCHPTRGDIASFTNSEESFAALVTDRKPVCGDRPYVTPGDPSRSYLYDMLFESAPECGVHMPPDSFLTNEELQMVYDWIVQGAKWEPASK